MPIRIYALAKELNIDSKELVEICKKTGIQGKGSALASLDDEEVAKVKAYLSGGSKPSVAKPKLAAAKQPAGADPKEPLKPEVYRREDYIAPGAGKSKVRVLDKKPAAPAEPGKETPAEPPKPKKKREPVINLAKIPESKQPPPPPKPSGELKPQKPEIRLSKDAITGQKKGDRTPLDEQIAKSEQKTPPPAAASKEPLETPLKGRGAKRGKVRTETPVDEAARGRRGLGGMATSRADRQKARRARAKTDAPGTPREEDATQQRRRRTLMRKGTNTAAPRKGKVQLELPCTVRSFSEATGVPSAQVQRALMGLGAMVTINATIDDELVELLASELGIELELRSAASLEDTLLHIREEEDADEDLLPRPPVITFLGHVDHGKTSLLDAIIGTNVVSGEAGGITQQIRAYQIDKEGRKISFVDTPGHEAFTEMRARGANVTDIAVLVIAADDGIMPQTEEAISHAKAAGVPIVVALNKVDLPGVDLNRPLTQLTEYELTPSEWGGDVEVVRTSAITGEGIDDLLETLLAIAELNEYKANPSRNAYGTCLEAEQEGGRGVIAKVMVQNGTLRIGQVLVCGSSYGRVKAMYDTLRPRQTVLEAGPSVPVNIIGLDSAPAAGEAFYVLDDIANAREIAEQRADRTREQGLSVFTPKVSFEEFQRRLQEGKLGGQEEVVTLNLIVRADMRGSIEAIQKELAKLEHPEVQLRTLQASVGGVTVGDVTLAAASEAVIIGFNVIPDEAARQLAEEKQVEIRRYDVIYKVTDDIRALLEGKLKPEQRVVELGRALVKQVFPISRVGTVAGCYVAQGVIERNCRIRVNRDGRTIGDYPLDSLRRIKEDVKEVTRGLECGIKLIGFDDVKKDDVLEAYKIEEVARTL